MLASTREWAHPVDKLNKNKIVMLFIYCLRDSFNTQLFTQFIYFVLSAFGAVKTVHSKSSDKMSLAYL